MQEDLSHTLSFKTPTVERLEALERSLEEEKEYVRVLEEKVDLIVTQFHEHIAQNDKTVYNGKI